MKGNSKIVTLYDGIIESYKADEMMKEEGFESEEKAAAAWFEEVTADNAWSDGEIPKYNKYICELPQSGADMYYDYGSDYYFAVKK